MAVEEGEGKDARACVGAAGGRAHARVSLFPAVLCVAAVCLLSCFRCAESGMGGDTSQIETDQGVTRIIGVTPDPIGGNVSRE